VHLHNDVSVALITLPTHGLQNTLCVPRRVVVDRREQIASVHCLVHEADFESLFCRPKRQDVDHTPKAASRLERFIDCGCVRLGVESRERSALPEWGLLRVA
jgi:hypothetical protein